MYHTVCMYVCIYIYKYICIYIYIYISILLALQSLRGARSPAPSQRGMLCDAMLYYIISYTSRFVRVILAQGPC